MVAKLKQHNRLESVLLPHAGRSPYWLVSSKHVFAAQVTVVKSRPTRPRLLRTMLLGQHQRSFLKS